MIDVSWEDDPGDVVLWAFITVDVDEDAWYGDGYVVELDWTLYCEEVLWLCTLLFIDDDSAFGEWPDDELEATGWESSSRLNFLLEVVVLIVPSPSSSEDDGSNIFFPIWEE
jgi:hypothetical protein